MHGGTSLGIGGVKSFAASQRPLPTSPARPQARGHPVGHDTGNGWRQPALQARKLPAQGCRLELVACADADGMDALGKARRLHEHGGLVPVRGWPVVFRVGGQHQVNHGASLASAPERPDTVLTPCPSTARLRQALTKTGVQTMTPHHASLPVATSHGRATRLPRAMRLQSTAGWCNVQPQLRV